MKGFTYWMEEDDGTMRIWMDDDFSIEKKREYWLGEKRNIESRLRKINQELAILDKLEASKKANDVR